MLKHVVFASVLAVALAGCQTMRHSMVQGREDVRLVEQVDSDGVVTKSFHQMKTPSGWFEAEEKNGTWGLTAVGKIDEQQASSGAGGGGGGC